MKQRRRRPPKQTMPKTKIILRRLPLFAKGSPFGGAGARLVEMAHTNAVERLARESGRYAREEKLLDELAQVLGLAKQGHRHPGKLLLDEGAEVHFQNIL